MILDNKHAIIHGAGGPVGAAVGALCGQLARELGPHGVRVVWLRSNGVASDGGDPTERARSMLHRLASPEDVGEVAALPGLGPGGGDDRHRRQHHLRRRGRLTQRRWIIHGHRRT
jgi:hypothetical protein